MKKLLCSLFIIFFTFTLCKAQKNALYISFQPDDIGVGLRYDRVLKPGLGTYASASFGNYIQGGYIKDHVKIATGAIAYAETGFVTLGIAYHHYSDNTIPIPIDKRAFEPLSIELGGGTHLGNAVVAFRMDVIKGTGVVEIGVNF